MSFEGSCHCGAVTIVVHDTPRWLTMCNCSVCRRIAALWFHTSPRNVTISAPPDGLINYTWDEKSLAFVSCRTCGCTTHWSPCTDVDRMALNMRMADPQRISGIRVRQFDGAETWKFLDDE